MSTFFNAPPIVLAITAIWLGLTLGYVCILAYLHFSSQKDKP